QPVIDDPEADHDAVRSLVVCSGKVYYDIVGHEARAQAEGTAITRVEQFYPFPVEPMAELVRSYPHLEELVWVQEEPQDMGAVRGPCLRAGRRIRLRGFGWIRFQMSQAVNASPSGPARRVTTRRKRPTRAAY